MLSEEEFIALAKEINEKNKKSSTLASRKNAPNGKDSLR